MKRQRMTVDEFRARAQESVPHKYHAKPIEVDGIRFDSTREAKRYAELRVAHERGIRTWMSLEPVIDPDQALQVIEATHRYVDEWKVGKINHNRELERRVDWVKFRETVTRLLDGLGAKYMLKRSLLEIT